MTEAITTSQRKTSFGDWFAQNWILVFIVVYGVWVWSPFLAPIFMRLGLETPANIVYWIYSFFCHQFAERSYFLFGENISYALSEIQSAGVTELTPLNLRRFIGNEAMGWKVAWSDRMISFYGGIWLVTLLFYTIRNKIKKLPIWGFVLFLLPMFFDGITHTISDFAGPGQGFRSSNLWLARLTSFAFSRSFYAGDMLGSFNAWMRIITGLLAAVGLVWFGFSFLFSSDSE